MSHVVVLIKPLIDKAKFNSLTRGTPGSACLDACYLRDEPMLLHAHTKALIPLAFEMALPLGWEAQVRSRSGLALKNGIKVFHGLGTIDSDYRQEVAAIMQNDNDQDFLISYGMKICQIAFAEVPTVELLLVDELDATDRLGGFGSTGLKIS